MDEGKIQLQRREHDEDATRERAAILGLQYLDTREIEVELPLAEGVLSIPEMYRGYLFPLTKGGDEVPYRFGITTQTPQSTVVALQKNLTIAETLCSFC